MRSKRRVLLAKALNDRSELRNHLKNGMGAFARRDVRLIAAAKRAQIGDSVDLDAAARDEFPEANRWDYVVSVPAVAQIVGIEPHSAKDAEISVVIAKKMHAIEYLRAHLQDGYRVAKWLWVSHGAVGFSRMERARRLLDQNGIEFVGRVLRTFG
jgi:hypothetical protein